MAQLATSAQLAARLGVTLTADEQARADALLELASGLVQAEAGQQIERVADDTLTRPGSYSDRVRLPERPVESVSSVTLDGVLLDASEWHLEGDELVRTPRLASTTFHGLPASGWGSPDVDLVVVYTHGYETIPDAIKAITLEAVVRAWVNPGSVVREAYGAEQVTYTPATPRGLLLTDAERRLVRDVLRRSAGSVALR